MNISREDVLHTIDRELTGENTCAENIKAARDELSAMESKGPINGEWIIYTFRPIIGWLIVLVKRFLRKLLHGYIPRIVDEENQRTLAQNRTAEFLLSAVESLQAQVTEIQEQRETVLKQLDDIREKQACLEEMRFELDEALRAAGADFDRKLAGMQGAIEATEAAFDQKLTPLLESAAAAARKAGKEKDILAKFPYELFEDRYRGTVDDILKRQSIYLKYFEGRDYVLDCGCGRGEFLSLLSSKGIRCKGIDSSGEMVSRCKRLGLDVEQADIFSYLEQLEDQVLDGVFCCQVVEHLTNAQLLEFIQLLSQKVRIGAPVVIETINPGTLPAGSNGFYMDLTHVRPVNSATLAFLMEINGFPLQNKLFIHRDVEHEVPELDMDGAGLFNERMRNVNDLLFGPWDYAIVAYKS